MLRGYQGHWAPPGYRRVEYIQSTGTQWIDTGFTPDQDTKAELDFKISMDLATGFPLFGARQSSSSRGYSFQRMGSGYWGGMYGDAFSTSSVATDLARHTVVKDRNVTYLDGAQLTSAIAATFTAPSSMTLNAMNTNGTVAVQNCAVRYYAFRIWDDGVLVRDYIPVVRISDGKPGLYDLCASTCTSTSSPFYVNGGTGDDFSYGEFSA